ncbi:hypothetical protein PG985_008465 [Apiospora marii]|uniref:uncharacterized protein n=1 Tax=Apiospora marii TaxID=335849 RepID=UPI00312F1F8E
MPTFLQSAANSSSSQAEETDMASGSDSGGQPPRSDNVPNGVFEDVKEPTKEQLEPIAVVGMGCRLPGDVRSASAFWDMMINKRTGQTPKVPNSRFNIDAHYHKNNDRPGSFGVLGGYFLNEDLSCFDPGVFGITPVEAMWMDPQQRKLLEVVYETLESGGISLERISGTRTAVFAASFTADWQQMAFKEPSFRHSLAATGVDPGIISNRISHVFNLNGPSIVCNTACSSSVYALHNACNALRNNEVEGAIVGGVNLIITVDQHMNTAKLGVLSPTSTCHTFDERANGYGRADAVGAVYLKRLADAVRDGDPIRGVIRSSAVNSNGKVPGVGITHPNKEGQADVIRQAYERCNLNPALTGYFECHGTGTAVGDPLEVHAASMVMNQSRKIEEGPLLIGAVKTSIGHSEAASGLSALIKAILIVERGIIPPTRGLVTPSTKIQWDEWRVKVPTEIVPLPSHLPVRRVSLNSFGYGGTNAHIIVEGTASLLGTRRLSYKYIDSCGTDSLKKNGIPQRVLHRRRPFLLLFSAHDKATLRRNIEAHGHVAHKYDLLDLSHTLAVRRSVLQSRAFTVSSHKKLKETFGDMPGHFTFGEHKRKSLPTLGFVFTGQGAQWPRMGAELLAYSSQFLQSIQALDDALEELPDGPEWSIEQLLLEDSKESLVHDAEFSQPLCTAVQIALVQLLAHWGIAPKVTVGHSSGEMAAAYAAGLISAEAAIAAAYYRGKVTRDVKSDGAMLAVGLGALEVEKYLDEEVANGKVVIACHNSPAAVTLSGDTDAVDAVKSRLDRDGVFARIVRTSGKAYHSHHMIPVVAKYESLLRASNASISHYPRESELTHEAKMVSSVTNNVLPSDSHLDETYWSSNLRSPVLFNQAVHTIMTSDEFADVDLLIEIGPHSAMAGPIKQSKVELKNEKLEYLPTLLRDTDSALQLLKLAGELFLRGYPIRKERVTNAYVDPLRGRSKGTARGLTIVDLPPYQWNYTRSLWAESRASQEQRQPRYPRHDVLGQLVVGCSLAEPTWRNILRQRDLPWLKHHSLGGESVFPAAGYLAMAIEAITQLHELGGGKAEAIESYTLRDISIQKALVTPDDDDGIEVMLNMRPATQGGSGWWDFSVSSVDTEKTPKEHTAGSIKFNVVPRGSKKARNVPIFPQRASGKAWNQALRTVGFDYGPTFQDMDDVRFDGKAYAASSRTAIKQHVDPALGESRYALHPSSVDSILQLSIAAIYAGRTNAVDCGVVPIQIDEVTFWTPTEDQLVAREAMAYAWVPRRGIRSFEGCAQMTASDGELVLDMVNIRTTSYEAAIPQKAETSLGHQASGAYGEMTWELDIDSLETAKSMGDLTFLDLASLILFKYPGLKLLELGGVSATELLQKVPNLDYTAVVPGDEGRADAAKRSVEGYPSATIATIDFGEDLKSQSLLPGTYDIVIAHSEPVLSSQRLFTETTDLLTGVDIYYSPTQRRTGSSVWRADGLRSCGEGDTLSRHKVDLVYRENQDEVTVSVKTSLEALNWEVRVMRLDSASVSDRSGQGVPSGHVVMLADLEGPLLYTITESEFSAVQAITNSSAAILWVTAGGLRAGKKPEFAVVEGFARAVSSEQASLDFRTLDVDLETVRPTDLVWHLTRIARLQVYGQEDAQGSREREYRLENGRLYISRLVRNHQLNDLFNPLQKPALTPFCSEMRITGKVSHGKVLFKQQSLPPTRETAIKSGHVEVQVQTCGLTKEGVLVVRGNDYPTTFSYEVGGVVSAVGPDVPELKVGDRVVGLHAGHFDSYQEVRAAMLQKLDRAYEMDAAVSMLTAYSNALYGLEVLARVKANETVLILHNTGTSGAAAIRISQIMGAIPYVEAFTDEEAAFLQKAFGLNEQQIIRPSQGPISTCIESLMRGSGADVVFSYGGSVSPTSTSESWRCIARFGRFIDAGRKDVLRRTTLDTTPQARGASYLPFDLLDLYNHAPEVLSGLLKSSMQLFKDGLITAPGRLRSLHLADLDQAIVDFSESFGAIQPILHYEGSEGSILTLPPPRPVLQFNPDHTYLLVGCLGGLGRSLTAWMMKHGARRFTFLSRSGADSDSASRLIRDIQQRGAIVQVIRGDATSRDDVVHAVESIPADYPIRGVVHAAMVLRDGLFHSMEYRNWKAAVAPKVMGAMNLHSVLTGTPLDFFLVTSSVSGTLGTPGQGNYAAGNSFLDSLAHHRAMSGEAATSVILPMVLGVGVVAEDEGLEDGLRRMGMYGIDEEQLLEAFEAGIMARQCFGYMPSHIAVGLDPAMLQNAMAEAGTSSVFWDRDPRFSHLVHVLASARDGAGAGEEQGALATISAATSLNEAIGIVTQHLIEKLGRMLMMPQDRFEPQGGSIASYGIDSLIGAELRNWIFKEYRMDMPFQQLLAPNLTIQKLSAQVCAAAGIQSLPSP